MSGAGNASPRFVVEEARRLMHAGRGREAAEAYFSRDYIEHNPSIAGGDWDGFVRRLDEFSRAGGPSGRGMEFHCHRLICQGDYVVVHQHVTEPGKPAIMIIDIYRVEHGLIVEHWDAWQSPPENPANLRHSLY